MRTIFRDVSVATGLLLALGGADVENVTPKGAPSSALSTRSWDVSDTASFSITPPTIDEVKVFLKEQVSTPDLEKDICSYEFVKLTGSSSYQLIVSVDYSGRRFCNHLYVFAKQGNAFNVSTFKVWNVDDVAPLIIGSVGDKKLLSLPIEYSNYDGANCLATWKRLVMWTGRRFSDVSRQFVSYYKNELSEKLKIKEPSDCEIMEVGKLKRFLDLDSQFDFVVARTWEASPSVSRRLKSIRIFNDINDEMSRKEIALLSHDSSPAVSNAATMSMKSKANQTPQQ